MELRTADRLAFRWPLVFTLGLFAFVAQALLFRAFLTVYEGNELGIGCFFSSWLLWVGVGALLARSRRALASRLVEHFEFLPLVYIPAYVLQLVLIQQSRQLAGIAGYDLFPFSRMFPVSFLANAPVSFCTGFLFTLACQWVSGRSSLAVAWVYIWEALGSCAGGVAATLLLWAGVRAEVVCSGAAILLALAVFVHGCGRRAYVWGALPVMILGAGVMLGLPQQWARLNDLQAWRRLLPASAYLGTFTTPQGSYHYGSYQGQFNVMAWESVVESVPNAEHAAEVIAVHLAQRPDARRFLVIGVGGYGICQRLAALPQAERITWLAPDPGYPRALLQVLPTEFKPRAGTLDIPGTDPRTFLQQRGEPYDIVILNLPDATTLSLNRYFTREFFLLLKPRLRPGGMVGVRVSAGENYMGTELANVGASVYHTLRTVFAEIAVKPGDESWLMASDGGGLSLNSLELRQRFRQVQGADQVYPPEGLISLYSPERIDYLLTHYRQAEATEAGQFLLNTDRNPRALLYALLFVARQTAAPDAVFAAVKIAGVCGFLFLAAAALLYVILRAVYLGRSAMSVAIEVRQLEGWTPTGLAANGDHGTKPVGVHASACPLLTPMGSAAGGESVAETAAEDIPSTELGTLSLTKSLSNVEGSKGRPPSESLGTAVNQVSSATLFDCRFLVFSTGAAGMGSSLLLMFIYQSRFGTLFLDLGLVTALFMLGLAAGSFAAGRLIVARGWHPRVVLAVGMAAHLLFLAAVLLLPVTGAPVLFFLYFLACGLLCGLYVPVAAATLKTAGTADAAAGSLIELHDHAGGALGGLFTGLFLLPVLGLPAALAVNAMLIAVNVTSLLPCQRLGARLWPRRESELAARRPDRFDAGVRATGYALFGIAALLLIGVAFHSRLTRIDLHQLVKQAAYTMAPSGVLTEETASLKDGGSLRYLRQESAPGAPPLYVFGSDQLAAGVRGYGGPIALAVTTDKDGVLKDFKVVSSNETPAYLKQVGTWMRSLLGRNIFENDPFKGIDAVSGATVTSTGVMRTLTQAGQEFAVQTLGHEGGPAPPARRFVLPDRTVIVLSALVALALVAQFTRLYHYRRAFMLLTLAGAGIYLNAQYSLEQVASALLFNFGAPGLNAGFVLVVGVPLLVILFGNVYCGYLCPFGALQEAVGWFCPCGFRHGMPRGPAVRQDRGPPALPQPPARDWPATWPRHLALVPRKAVWRYTRAAKYLLLFAAVCLLATSAASTVSSLDPLVTVFSRHRGMAATLIAIAALALAVVYPRFWCRTFCVPGAFLSLLGGLHLLRRFMPEVHPRACIYGVRHREELDCIRCDRCRAPSTAATQEMQAAERGPQGRRPDSIYLWVAFVFALVCAQLLLPLWRAEMQQQASAASTAAGRAVDMAKLRLLLDAGRLSGHEALHYRPADTPAPAPPR